MPVQVKKESKAANVMSFIVLGALGLCLVALAVGFTVKVISGWFS